MSKPAVQNAVCRSEFLGATDGNLYKECFNLVYGVCVAGGWCTVRECITSKGAWSEKAMSTNIGSIIKKVSGRYLPTTAYTAPKTKCCQQTLREIELTSDNP